MTVVHSKGEIYNTTVTFYSLIIFIIAFLSLFIFSIVNSEVVFYMTFLCGLTSTLSQFTDEFDDIWPSRISAKS